MRRKVLLVLAAAVLLGAAAWAIWGLVTSTQDRAEQNAIFMTIPFRCAPRHQREMKHSASNAASQNLLECV